MGTAHYSTKTPKLSFFLSLLAGFKILGHVPSTGVTWEGLSDNLDEAKKRKMQRKIAIF
jgi:hypothetical protein